MRLISHHIIILLVLCCLTPNAWANEERLDKVKAVFLYKFFDYVTWQKAHDPIANPPAIICTFGNVAFKSTLKLLSEKQQHTLQNATKAVDSLNDTKSCHVLFLSSEKSGALMHANLDHILTVSDAAGFAKNGGMIELNETPDKLELIINLNTVKNSHLKIRSGLLEIAEVIR